MSCSSFGFPSGLGFGAVVAEGVGAGPLQYATALRSNSDIQVGSISCKNNNQSTNYSYIFSF